jgi:7-cyano-7-deazaguanine synthase
MPKPKAVVIMSGGLDSTTLFHYARQHNDCYALSFDYGQRHVKELDCAARTCVTFGVDHTVVDLTSMQDHLKSSLTFHDEVPEGHYSSENMKQTIVPNRNAIMLSIAWGYAVSLQAQKVFIGAHAGDHPIYPDCRDEFFQSLEATLQLGTETPITIERPFILVSKSDIVTFGVAFGVEFENTWSCYKGGQIACGRCGTCVERLEAFELAGYQDPLPYEDREYWQTVTKHAAR